MLFENRMIETAGLVSYVFGGFMAFLGIIGMIITITKFVYSCHAARLEERLNGRSSAALSVCIDEPQAPSERCVGSVNPDGSVAVARELGKHQELK